MLQLKSEVIVVIKKFFLMGKTQFGPQVIVMRSDNVTSFLNHQCSTLFQHLVTLHQSRFPHTPQQNGIVER